MGEAHIDPIYLENVDYMMQAGENLLVLINKVLDLSKIEVEQMQVNVSAFNLQELVSELLVLVQPMVETNRNALVVKNLTVVTTITSDRMKMRQILLNLLGNAAKFTTDGSITFEITDSLLHDKPALAFAVIDDGIGIAAEQLETIFDAFVQVDDSFSRSYEGTGLGLAISKGFAKLLDGELTVESRFGEGSTFSLIIPFGG